MKDTLYDLKHRRAVRKYKPVPVRREDLEAVLEAGIYAPTARGSQRACLVSVTNKEDRDAVSELNRGIMGADYDPFYGAPTVLVVFADRGRRTYVDDGNMMIANLLNAAHAVGVDSCYIYRAREVFASPEGRELASKWGLGDNYEAIGNCILGYGLPEGIKEAAPRKADYIIRV